MNLFKFLKSILVAFVFVSIFAFASHTFAYINTFAIGGTGGSSVTGTEEMAVTTYVVGAPIEFWGEMEFNAGNASAPTSTIVNMKVTVAGTGINGTIISNKTISAIANPKYVQGYYSTTITTPGSYTAHFIAHAFGVDKTYNLPFTVVAGGAGNGMTVSVIASPNKIYQGQTSTISWTSTGATACNSYGHGNGVSGSFVTAPLSASTNYLVVCSAPSNEIVDNIGLENNGHYVSGTEKVSGSSFLPGATITLNGFMQASGIPNGSTFVGLKAKIQGVSNTVVIIPDSTELNYLDTEPFEHVEGSNTLTAPNTPGNYEILFTRKAFGEFTTKSIFFTVSTQTGVTATGSASVEVEMPIELNFDAIPPSVAFGSTTHLVWESVGADLCNLTGGDVYGAGLSGNVVSNPRSRASYFLTRAAANPPDL